MPAKKKANNERERSVSINMGGKEHSVAIEEHRQEEKVVEFKPQIDKLTAVDSNQPINK